MSQKLSLGNFKWIEETSEFNEDFIKSYDDDNDDDSDDIFSKLISSTYKNLHNLQNDLPFLHERMRIEKVKKLVANLRNKTEYVTDIRKLKQALNHGLVSKQTYIK